MKEKPNIRPEQDVNRALCALRETPIPAGPSPETLRAVLAAGASETSRIKPKTIIERIFQMNRIAKVAASIVIVAGIAGLFVWLTVGKGGTTIAWADVQEKIRNARTVTFKMTIRPTKDSATIEMKMMLMEPGLMRQEMTKPEKVVGIMDFQKGTILSLVEKDKKAILIDLSGLPEKVRKQRENQNYMAALKKLVEESETELGEKEIAGRKAKGYRVEKGKQVITIWADAKTGVPLEMEMTMFQGEMKVTMSDFEFDKKLDKELFSLEVPKGYTLMEHKMEIKPGTIEDVVEMLRIWTKVRGGTFPQTLSPTQFAKDAKAYKDVEKDLSDEEKFKKGAILARAIVLIQMHPEAHYAGKGVKLGDAGTAVFWYKPKDSETYKVIYGDLSIKDVAKDDLPTTQPVAESDKTATEE